VNRYSRKLFKHGRALNDTQYFNHSVLLYRANVQLHISNGVTIGHYIGAMV